MQKYFYQLAALLFAALSFTACTAEEDPTESETLKVTVTKKLPTTTNEVTPGEKVQLSIELLSTDRTIKQIKIYKNEELFFDYEGETPQDLFDNKSKLRTGDDIVEITAKKLYRYEFFDVMTLADQQNNRDLVYRFEIIDSNNQKNPVAGSVYTFTKKASVTPPPASSLVMDAAKTISLRNRETSTEMGLRYASNPTATSSKVAITATNLMVPAPAGIDATSFAAVKAAYDQGTGVKEVVLTSADAGKLYITKLATDNYTFVKIVKVDPLKVNTGYSYNGKIDFEYRQTAIKMDQPK